MTITRLLRTGTAAVSVSMCLAFPFAYGQEAGIEEELVVIGVTPAGATGMAAAKIPYSVQSANADDIERIQPQGLADFLNRTLESVSINDAQNNPLQPDVQYRGFTASPLLGLAQGLAVYQNGVRINEPLGDAVNWDLLPESAIQSIDLIGGANPLFGLNTLGGALAVQMKNGFDSPGHFLAAQGGSFGRRILTAESGGNNGSLAYYANIHHFTEDGWRDQSPSDALNLYGSAGWKEAGSALNLNLQHGDSELIGNGAIPVELLQTDRSAVFTAPDITENNMYMVSMNGVYGLTNKVDLSATGFYRRNTTESFNGDASDFTLCGLGGMDALLAGLEEDYLEELGLDEDDVCGNQFTDADALENFLNNTAAALGEEEEFNLQDLTDELSGTGTLSDAAINNISARTQKSYGGDVQLAWSGDLINRGNQLIIGGAYFRGEVNFKSQLELARLDPVTRSTAGLGTGTFVADQAVHIDTTSETFSFYITDTLDVTSNFSITLSGRFNTTEIELADRSGEQPELNGKHNFNRFNPAVGLTYRINSSLNLYASYSESARAPTPIELSCNEQIFDLAAANAAAAGEDPDDVEFECRLPNAFLADPPLEQVVTRSFEVGARGALRGIIYHAGFFHSVNDDDVIFQTTGRSTGLFANVAQTRRWGFESGFFGNLGNLDWFLAYSNIHSTFEDNFEVISPNHPLADPGSGTLAVAAGSDIPGIPDHQLKLGGDYIFSDAFSLGLELLYNSTQYLRGDEANRLRPVNGYAVVNLRGRYRLNRRVEFFARVGNLFDSDYETFGLLGEDPRGVDLPLFDAYANPRFLGPGAPRSAFAGIRLSL